MDSRKALSPYTIVGGRRTNYRVTAWAEGLEFMGNHHETTTKVLGHAAGLT